MGANASGLMSLFGGLLNATSDINESQDKARILEEEALAAEQSAVIARNAGRYNAERQQIAAEKVFGGIEADYAASGISSDSTSALEVLRQSHTNAELDRQNIIYGSELEALGLEDRARAAKSGSASSLRAGKINAFATLFDSAAKYADRSGGAKEKGTKSTGSNGYSSDFRKGNLYVDSNYG